MYTFRTINVIVIQTYIIALCTAKDREFLLFDFMIVWRDVQYGAAHKLVLNAFDCVSCPWFAIKYYGN